MRNPRRTATAALLGAAALLLGGSHADEPAGGGEIIHLFDDLGDRTHPITTKVPRAQRYFDQGMALTWGFNHDAAVRSFREAARLDPSCAMCFWGVALALGPNINAPMGPDAGREAYAAIRKAQSLAEGASPAERAYIAALATRYAAEPPEDRAPLDRAYAAAMGEVVRAHPDDLDAATLHAEALMDLSPWAYWTPEGEATEHTGAIVSALESVLARDANHPGANHYYIHAVEASTQPERAVPAADRLSGLVPGSGHLTHMPSHIYFRVGRYRDALEINRRAVGADEGYFGWCRRQGIYGALYYPHNIHFLWAAAMVEGSSDVALTAARKLVAQIRQQELDAFPFTEEFLPTPLFTLARFGRWDAILAEPRPPAERRYWTGISHYARGVAQVRRGDADAAGAERASLAAIADEAPLAELRFPGGTAQDLLRIALAHLDGEAAAVRGDTDAAVAALEDAVRRQDALSYTEPPPWYFPTRQALGAVLLEAGRAEEADAVYRADLERNPRNGWSLYGLGRSLRARGKGPEAEMAERGFANAWARADVELSASRF